MNNFVLAILLPLAVILRDYRPHSKEKRMIWAFALEVALLAALQSDFTGKSFADAEQAVEVYTLGTNSKLDFVPWIKPGLKGQWR